MRSYLSQGSLYGAALVFNVLVFSVLAQASTLPDQPAQIVGEASKLGTDELLYREFYYCPGEGELCTVEYREPDGNIIARKLLDYTIGPYTPTVEIVDFRHSKNITIASQPEDGLVVDAGFDNYVRSRWDELAAGETVKFRLRIVGADKPFKMRARQFEGDNCQDIQLCVRVEVDSWLIGLVAPAIELAYSRDARQLLRFSGTSNIRSVDDKSQQVDIAYRYDTDDLDDTASVSR